MDIRQTGRPNEAKCWHDQTKRAKPTDRLLDPSFGGGGEYFLTGELKAMGNIYLYVKNFCH